MSDEQFGYLLVMLMGFGFLWAGLTAAVKKLPETSFMFTLVGLITVFGTAMIWLVRT